MEQREIKFRAWVTPDDVYFKKEGPHMIGPETLKEMANGKLTAFPGEWTWHCLKFMQYTGLLDKKGVEIYEGDIMAWEQYEGKKHQTRWTVEYNPEKGFKSWHSVPDDAIVIGNLYQHPELLQK